MRWTEDQLAAHLARTGIPGAPNRADTSAPPFSGSPANGRRALGRLPAGDMNKTEQAYDRHLWQLHAAGEVLWHKFEGIKLRLASNTFLTIDFAVMRADGLIELHEVKGGYWEDDARVKIKVAASLYPFRFIGVMPIPKSKGGGWKVEEF